MESLFGFLILLITIASAIGKNLGKQSANSAKTATVPQRPAAAKPAAPAQSARPASMATMLPPREGVSAHPLFQDGSALTPSQPRVHLHLEPECETDDAPGSLGEGSLEGRDMCHEEQLSGMRAATAASAAPRSQLTLDWSGDQLVKAFVMQEVLTRPSQRQRR